MATWFILSFTYHMVCIPWLSSRSVIKQHWEAGEELEEGLLGSELESRLLAQVHKRDLQTKSQISDSLS